MLMRRILLQRTALSALAIVFLRPSSGQTAPRSFEILTRRMDADCDGAPRAYGPPGKAALDDLINAHTLGNPRAPIVGYLTEPGHPDKPLLQGPNDPAPGYYISQTTFTDPSRPNERDPLSYVDASRINYVVLGNRARHLGAKVGDFVAVHSYLTGRSVFAIVGDSGNPSGDEGSLHLLQQLGYGFHDCKQESVGQSEVVIRFFPHSNPQSMFFRSQGALDEAARKLGLSLEFARAKRTKAGSR